MTSYNDLYRQHQGRIFFSKADFPYGKHFELNLQDIDIQNIFKQKLGITPISYIPFSRSTLHIVYHISYDSRNFILRINKWSNAYREYNFFIEEWVNKILQNYNLPYVNTICVDVSRIIVPFDYQITEYLEGKTLYELYQLQTHKINPVLFYQFGELTGKIHTVKTKHFGFFNIKNIIDNNKGVGIHFQWRKHISKNFGKHLAFCLDKKIITHKMHNDILTLFLSSLFILDEIDPVLLHGDLANHNVFTDGKKILTLIDWEDCLSGDPVYDIAYYGTGSFDHPEWFHSFISGYQSIKKLPSNFQLRYWFYFLRISIVKAVVRYRLGTKGTKNLPSIKERIEKSISELSKTL